ncbi:hypothetical protein CRE_24646 [Caenorhabditis remanei]|uniref:Uncharacterized protein n=1 Tax=Caenorhabditis remanei TaxID=31234 RepID=E3N3V2_CAERE|nr:hypothetical protein CRE_24646 [Caenorhabditis remanei]
MASSLLKIAEVCFPEFKDTELLYSITKSFEKGKLTNPPYSLMDATIECLMKDALEDEEVLQQIGNILRNYPLQLSSLYLLQGNPEMLKIAFDWSFSRDNGPLSIDIQNYTCILTVKKYIIAEFAIKQGFDYPKAIVLSAVQKGCMKLRVSVTECPSDNETSQQKIERFVRDLQLEPKLAGQPCTIDCYIRREFHFQSLRGSHIYFTKFTGSDGICRHDANMSLKDL